MMQYLAKVAISAIVIVLVAEISKRSSVWGALVASLPVVSLMAMLWLYFDTGDVSKVAALSRSVFWMVLPSLAFFLILPVLLKTNLHFYLSFALALIFMLVCYGLGLWLASRLGRNTAL